MTGGAGIQQSACGGFSDAAFSPSGIVDGRWKTQTLSCESTATPPTWPVTHLFGSASNHNGSGSKIGTRGRLAWALERTRTSPVTIVNVFIGDSARSALYDD